MTPSKDDSGHFTCPAPGPEYSYHLISVEDYYQDYHLTHSLVLEASYPGQGSHSDRVLHLFNTSQFCVAYNQVLGNTSLAVEQTFRVCVRHLRVVKGQVCRFLVSNFQLIFVS